VLYILKILEPYEIHHLQIFSPILCFSFNFFLIVYSEAHVFSVAMKSNLLFFYVGTCLYFGIIISETVSNTNNVMNIYPVFSSLSL
jgi:hypothetical protein